MWTSPHTSQEKQMKKKLRKLNIAQYYIQLATAMLFAYIAIIDINPIKMMIAFLLLFGWSLGYYRHRLIRRRLGRKVIK